MAFRGNMTPSLPTPNPSQEGNLPSDRKRDSPPGRGYREYFQGPSHFSPVYGPTALLAHDCGVQRPPSVSNTAVGQYDEHAKTVCIHI